MTVVRGECIVFSMDASHLECQACGREFSGPGPLTFHIRTCRSSKKRLRGALAKASEVWAARKKSRMYASLGDLPPLYDVPNTMPVAIAASSPNPIAQTSPSQEVEPVDDVVSIFIS